LPMIRLLSARDTKAKRSCEHFESAVDQCIVAGAAME
jgi:hypothetical protein